MINLYQAVKDGTITPELAMAAKRAIDLGWVAERTMLFDEEGVDGWLWTLDRVGEPSMEYYTIGEEFDIPAEVNEWVSMIEAHLDSKAEHGT